ncbi:MAG: rhomboid family intramembrane serine protease [Rubripirellula sp.]
MIIPYGTDAPVYHLPFTTIGVIVLNTVIFLATGMGHDAQYDWLALQFDQVNPLQWITAAFMHGSFGHLIGNMIFLWCFGLIVEGKLGWHRFAMLYLGLALADGAVGQVPMFLFSSHGGQAVGASGVIFALIVIAMIWAPKNEIQVFYWLFFFFVGTFEVSVLTMGWFFLAWEVLTVFFVTGLFGLQMSSAVLHLLGASVGVPFAVYMLQTKRVDCEGYDLFTQMGWSTGIRPQHFNLLWFLGYFFKPAVPDSAGHDSPGIDSPASPNAIQKGAGTQRSNQQADVARQPINSPYQPLFGKPAAIANRDPCADALHHFAIAVESQQSQTAISGMRELQRGGWIAAIPEPTLLRYVKLLSRESRHEELLVPLQLLVMRKSRYANDACLQIARIQWKHCQDSEAAIDSLKKMVLPMSDRVSQHRSKLLREIKSSSTSD